MRNIIIKDLRNRTLEGLFAISEEVDILIAGNIIKMNRNQGMDLMIETVQALRESKEFWVRKGYKDCPGLYDKLVNDYNQEKAGEDHLTRWC